MDAADDYLQMSGIQHFCFCRRQWELIHLEQQWAENLRTAEGRLEHSRCHDATQTERRRAGPLCRFFASCPARPPQPCT